MRLRFINGSAMTYFDVRVPGLEMTVVQADGQDVQPVAGEEFRIAEAETYDVIVEPEGDRAYTLFAEAMDRSGYARGTLAPREGLSAPVPEMRPRPLLTMADMGMAHGAMSGPQAAGMGRHGPANGGNARDGAWGHGRRLGERYDGDDARARRSRTFATIADSLDIPGYAVKALLNHKGGSDVTAGYVVASTERLRELMQKICDYVLRCAGVEVSAEVLPFERADGPQLRVTT